MANLLFFRFAFVIISYYLTESLIQIALIQRMFQERLFVALIQRQQRRSCWKNTCWSL